MPAVKLAKDLEPGDRVLVSLAKGNDREVLTVLALVESEQVVRRKVLMVTVRNAAGHDTHRQWLPNRPVDIVSEGGSPSDA